MDIYSLLSIIITLAIIIGYINHRFVKMQPTIAIMVSSLFLSLILIVVGQLGFIHLENYVTQLLTKLDFYHLLMNGMLSFLLFAGALTVDINALRSQKWEITVLSGLGTIFSAILIGVFSYYLLPLLGYHLPFIYCMLFGALISPTDPIAVLATFKTLGAPKSLNVQVAGESLFNDGVGIVMFLTLYQLAFTGHVVTWQSVSLLFLQQAVGGILYGIVLGLIAYFLIKPINDHIMEILITLAVATGGYALAGILKISGPLAMVVAGIFIGNKGRQFSMSQKTRENLDNFWELIDELLNAALFLLIGLELLIIHITKSTISAAVLAIPMVLLARTLIVVAPMSLFKLKRKYAPLTNRILIWGGLRGGLAVALALSLPQGDHRSLILTMTYAVVLFSIIIQGSTIKHLVVVSLKRIATTSSSR